MAKMIGVVQYFHTGESELRLLPISETREKLAEEIFRLPTGMSVSLRGDAYRIQDLRASDGVCLEFSVDADVKIITHIDVQSIGNSRSSCSITSVDGSQTCSITCPPAFNPNLNEAKCTRGQDWASCGCT